MWKDRPFKSIGEMIPVFRPVCSPPAPLGKAALGANLALIRLSKTLFSYQIYVEAETTPDVSFVLKDSK